MIQCRLLKRTGVVLAAALTLSVWRLPAPPPAAAHQDPTVAVRLVSVEPALPVSASVEVLDGERTLLGLSNRSAAPATVLDPEGNPFLVVSSRGVFGDLRSPFLGASRAVGESAMTPPRGCCPNARWKLLSDEPGWVWPDPRLDPPLRGAGSGGTRGLSALGQSAPLAQWAVPVRVGDRTSVLRGVVERRQVGAVKTTIHAAPGEMEISVVDSAPPQLRMTLRAGTRAEVVGTDGRPFIRVDREGAFGRSSSPDYQLSRRAMGLPPSPGDGWMPVAGGNSTTVTWADRRLDFQRAAPSAGTEGSVNLGTWRIPVVVDGRPDEIVGESVWTRAPVPEIALDRPSSGFWRTGGWVSYAIAGGLTLVLLAAIGLVRRRARREES